MPNSYLQIVTELIKWPAYYIYLPLFPPPSLSLHTPFQYLMLRTFYMQNSLRKTIHNICILLNITLKYVKFNATLFAANRYVRKSSLRQVHRLHFKLYIGAIIQCIKLRERLDKFPGKGNLKLFMLFSGAESGYCVEYSYVYVFSNVIFYSYVTKYSFGCTDQSECCYKM